MRKSNGKMEMGEEKDVHFLISFEGGFGDLIGFLLARGFIFATATSSFERIQEK